jgi:hypothetical protein
VCGSNVECHEAVAFVASGQGGYTQLPMVSATGHVVPQGQTLAPEHTPSARQSLSIQQPAGNALQTPATHSPLLGQSLLKRQQLSFAGTQTPA